ncbi:MAG TPA: hypothetical protein VGU63_03915 [Candidatus Acidoferrales bacterium]|nr:hypothetical protein [Candidatus Acidoferrales bacterium]
MRSIRNLAFVASLFVACAAVWAQGKSAPNWDAWKFLQGKWVGDGYNERTQGSGYASFELDLQNKVWVRRNHAEYPGPSGSPAQVHDDLMIIYFNYSSGQTRAFYTDSEGHVINYTASFSRDGKQLIFLGDRPDSGPRYRLTYIITAPDHMSVELDMAQPAASDTWQKIVFGKIKKVASS